MMMVPVTSSLLLWSILLLGCNTVGAFLDNTRSLATRRASSQTSLLFSSTLELVDTQQHGVTFTKTRKNRESRFMDDDTSPLMTLKPISRGAIILESSRPLLTRHECNILRHYFEVGPTAARGQHVLQRVQAQIDELTACPWHSGEAALPRLLRYHPLPPPPPVLSSSSSNTTSTPILPDGLHVDTNNGKLFRHVTCLLYLTTNDDGATMFPIANHGRHSRLAQTADSLIDSNVHHTKQVEPSSECLALEKAAEDCHHEPISKGGLRVLPEAGKLVVFCNVLESGKADPLTFHGGEAVYTTEKVLLAFFKEVPTDLFSSQEEFGQRAAATRRYLTERYY